MVNPALTVIVVKYKEPFSFIENCLESLAYQEGVKLEVLLLDQMYTYDCRNLLERFRVQHKFKYINISDISGACLSFAKNF